MRWKKITLAGVGLLGGSLGLALRRAGDAGCVAGYVRRVESIRECEKAGAVDFATCDLHKAIDQADIVVLCTPLAQMLPLARAMMPLLKPGAIVTDVGSVKGKLVSDLERLFDKSQVRVVGSHPMAGGEKMGVSAARADLFVNSACIVTPTTRTNPAALRAVTRLWRSVGGRILKMDPKVHDQLVARSSHLPHFVAAAVTNAVLDGAAHKNQHAVCANGFRDVTRVASGSPEMWKDIALDNSKAISKTLGLFVRDLQRLQKAIDSRDARRLEQYLTSAKKLRDGWQNHCSTTNLD